MRVRHPRQRAPRRRRAALDPAAGALAGSDAGGAYRSDAHRPRPGARYRLRYLVATNPDYGTGPMQPKTLEVYWGGVLVDVLHPDPVGGTVRDMKWELRTLDLTARAHVTALQLRSLDESNSGPAIDRVTLDRL